MKEDVLQFIWKMKRLPNQPIYTTAGDPIRILDFGEINYDQGPDFLNGRVLIGDIEFVGSIEIHRKSSDWIKHNHSSSKQYDNVILHVVYNHDSEIVNSYKRPIPTIELKELIDPYLLLNYQRIMDSKIDVPCQSMIKRIDKLYWRSFQDRLFAERLDRKAKLISIDLLRSGNNWEETFYRLLFKYVAMGVNSGMFFELAKSIPLSCINKLGKDILAVKAVLYGQANLLEDVANEYEIKLREEYEYQKIKLRLKKNYFQLKYSRMRPANFPTVRILQLSSLLVERPRLFQKIVQSETKENVINILTVDPNIHSVNTQYVGIKNTDKTGPFGLYTINSLILNLVVPSMYAYGKYIGDENLLRNATRIMEATDCENNKVIRMWKGLSVPCSNGYDSQSLLELYNNYCSHKKCLNCAIGFKTITGQ